MLSASIIAAVYPTSFAMRVHWLQHAEHEGLGCIGPWLDARGFRCTHSALHQGEPLPPAHAFDWLIVMGGPMNIHEEARYPWLAAEKSLIRDACVMNKQVLGICLGAQLMAHVLGGEVTKNAYAEIGFFDVTLNQEDDRHGLFADFPRSFPAFHWHEDTFSYPPGATGLMSSQGCPRQAYVWGEGRGVGLQFHLEVREEDARQWLRLESPPPARYVQPAAEILRDPARFALNCRLMVALLERMAKRGTAPA
jgi:GMP synthase-like glutamine amidotransferase